MVTYPRVSLLMAAGKAPWAVSSSEHSELGTMSTISCLMDVDAEQGAGSLLITGEGRQDTCLVIIPP
jgi:hypothetical protein